MNIKTTIALFALLVLPGCVPTKWARQIPENKDFRGRLVSPWGTLDIDTRVNPAGTNPLLPLPSPGGIVIMTNGSVLITPE